MVDLVVCRNMWGGERAEAGQAGRCQAPKGLAQQANKSRFPHQGDRASLKVLSKAVPHQYGFTAIF